tara:strand:- start:131 stop:808 length:678 start_codon:yes stop_codon:yes gene_type:complete
MNDEKKDTKEETETVAPPPKKKLSIKLDYFQIAIYGGPALIFFLLFVAAKHFLFVPPSHEEVITIIEKKAVDPFKHLEVDPPLKMAEVLAKERAKERAKAEAETEVLADGTIKFLSPRYKYYEFSGPLATNLIGSKKILTVNISVAVYETPMKAEDFYEVFEFFVPVLRSIVIKEIGDFTLEMAEDEPTVYQFRKFLLEAFNKKLRDLGSQPILKKVVFSSFVIT